MFTDPEYFCVPVQWHNKSRLHNNKPLKSTTDLFSFDSEIRERECDIWQRDRELKKEWACQEYWFHKEGIKMMKTKYNPKIESVRRSQGSTALCHDVLSEPVDSRAHAAHQLQWEIYLWLYPRRASSPPEQKAWNLENLFKHWPQTDYRVIIKCRPSAWSI